MKMPAETPSAPEWDLLISAVETNDRHGGGILLLRLFPDSADFVCLRTTSLYSGEEPFGSRHHELCSRYLTLAETEEHLSRILRLYRIRRILCVPYYREEFVHATVAKRLTGAPLCTYLMDDQNVFAREVPDHWMARLLDVSDLILGISPELCAAYQVKYGRAIHLLPPILEHFVPTVPCYWEAYPAEPLRAAMIGNVWTAPTFHKLRRLLRETGLEIDWYGNGPKATWLEGSPEEWEADHIHCLGFLPEEDLVAALASYPFVIVPSGTLDEDDDNPAFSRLSLPSRLLFLHARTDTPVLVLGSPETSAGRFVESIPSGVCARYDAGSLRTAIGHLITPAIHRQLRANIRKLAPSLILPGAGQWIWDSLSQGSPQPARFHHLFPPVPASAPWLAAIQPSKPLPQPRLPVNQAGFRDEHMPACAFLREAHRDLLTMRGYDLPAVNELELSQFMEAQTGEILQGLVHAGGDILFLGHAIPPFVNRGCQHARLWRIANLQDWQQSGYAGSPEMIAGPEPYGDRFPQFDAIVSTGWLGELPDDPHALEGVSLYLEACLRPGGCNLHFFAAVINTAYYWTPPAWKYLHDRFLPAANWPGLDDILCTSDVFTISSAVYARTWQPSTQKDHAAFGSPLGVSLFWRKAAGPA